MSSLCQQSLLSCASTKPRRHKRATFPEREAVLSVGPPFVSILPLLFFKKTRSHLPVDKRALPLVLPQPTASPGTSIYIEVVSFLSVATHAHFEECQPRWQISSPALSLWQTSSFSRPERRSCCSEGPQQCFPLPPSGCCFHFGVSWLCSCPLALLLSASPS